MPLLPNLSRCALLVSACFLGVAGSRAELLKVSPFLGPQSSSSTPTQNAPLEYRGSMSMADVRQFRVVDPAHKVGTWLKVGEKDANLDVTLKGHDDSHDTITVEHGGQTMTLQLKAPKVVSSGAMPTPIMPALRPSNVSAAVIQSVVPNPTPADEQRRLEAVAAEVARRRALREQAIQQAQNRSQLGQPAPVNASRADIQRAQELMRSQRR